MGFELIKEYLSGKHYLNKLLELLEEQKEKGHEVYLDYKGKIIPALSKINLKITMVKDKKNEKLTIKSDEENLEGKVNRYFILSPSVGTFYRFDKILGISIEEGEEVSIGDTIGIIEALKIPNEVKLVKPEERRNVNLGTCFYEEIEPEDYRVSEKVNKAKIKKVEVENGEPVEYGQELYEVDPIE